MIPMTSSDYFFRYKLLKTLLPLIGYTWEPKLSIKAEYKNNVTKTKVTLLPPSTMTHTTLE